MGGKYELLFDSALRLEGLARHVSTHACGIVIGKTDLKNYVPLYFDNKTNSIATQYDKKYIEDCGLVKMDLPVLEKKDYSSLRERFAALSARFTSKRFTA